MCWLHRLIGDVLSLLEMINCSNWRNWQESYNCNRQWYNTMLYIVIIYWIYKFINIERSKKTYTVFWSINPFTTIYYKLFIKFDIKSNGQYVRFNSEHEKHFNNFYIDILGYMGHYRVYVENLHDIIKKYLEIIFFYI